MHFANKFVCGPISLLTFVIFIYLVPSAPPSNVRVVYVDHMSIVVEWDLVPAGSENGVIQGYMVKYWKRDSAVRNETVKDFTATLSAEENKSYTIQVAAYTSMGVGSFCEPITTQTGVCK